MAFDSHINFGYTHVATAPSPAASGTSLVVTAGYGATIAAALAIARSTGQVNATIFPDGAIPSAANAEIVRITAVSTDTLTIVRQQEGSSARTIGVGDAVAFSMTAKSFTDIETAIQDTRGRAAFNLVD